MKPRCITRTLILDRMAKKVLDGTKRSLHSYIYHQLATTHTEVQRAQIEAILRARWGAITDSILLMRVLGNDRDVILGYRVD